MRNKKGRVKKNMGKRGAEHAKEREFHKPPKEKLKMPPVEFDDINEHYYSTENYRDLEREEWDETKDFL